jgi:hypothetical protein
MGLENITSGAASTIADLNASNPLSGDGLGQADDHLRNIKHALHLTFPNISATVSGVAAELAFAHKGGTVSGTGIFLFNVDIAGSLTVSATTVVKTKIITNALQCSATLTAHVTSAIEADHAKSASYALSALVAQSAVHAASASFANSAVHAISANTALSANHAGSASYALSALVAQSAVHAASASYALSALFAVSAGVANSVTASSIVQGSLSTSLQQNTGPIGTAGSANILYTGGSYSMMAGLHVLNATAQDVRLTPYYTGSGTYLNGINLKNDTGASRTYYFQTRYINASPPYDLGDGQIPEFYYVILNNNGDVIGYDISSAPPWIYNGPTKVTADRYGKNGKQYINREVLPKALLNKPDISAPIKTKIAHQKAMLEFRQAPVIKEFELTPLMKNADMDLIPHPFIGNDMTNKNIVLLDPVSPVVNQLSILRNEGKGEDVGEEIIKAGLLSIGNTPLTRKGPKGVMIVSVDWK